MRLSYMSNIMRLRVYAIACGLLVLILLTLADQISMHFGLGEWQRFVDDICGGIVAGLLFYLYERSRIKNLNEKLKTIELMNHHVRNALQVILDSAYLHGHSQQISHMQESVRRIDWALREILPGTLDEFADRSGENRAA